MKQYRHIWKILVFDMCVIELGPVLVFLIAFYLSDFGTAALSLGIATILALVLSKLVNQRLPKFALFSGAATFITALLTYIFTAPWVLIVTDSLGYFGFASFLAVSLWQQWHILEKFFGHIFAIKRVGWAILERRWLGFFIVMGISNEFVRIFLTASDWILFKQAAIVMFVLFGLYQFRVSRQYRLPGSDGLGLWQA